MTITLMSARNNSRRLKQSKMLLCFKMTTLDRSILEISLGCEGQEYFGMAEYIEVGTSAGETPLCSHVCMVITYSRVWINRVRLPILLVVS